MWKGCNWFLQTNTLATASTMFTQLSPVKYGLNSYLSIYLPCIWVNWRNNIKLDREMSSNKAWVWAGAKKNSWPFSHSMPELVTLFSLEKKNKTWSSSGRVENTCSSNFYREIFQQLRPENPPAGFSRKMSSDFFCGTLQRVLQQIFPSGSVNNSGRQWVVRLSGRLSESFDDGTPGFVPAEATVGKG